jgi:hypothetical protein
MTGAAPISSIEAFEWTRFRLGPLATRTDDAIVAGHLPIYLLPLLVRDGHHLIGALAGVGRRESLLLEPGSILIQTGTIVLQP